MCTFCMHSDYLLLCIATRSSRSPALRMQQGAHIKILHTSRSMLNRDLLLPIHQATCGVSSSRRYLFRILCSKFCFGRATKFQCHVTGNSYFDLKCTQQGKHDFSSRASWTFSAFAGLNFRSGQN